MAKKAKEKPVRTDNLIDYVREEQRTFKQKPFCVEDSLVLSVLAYFDFEGFVPKASILSIPVRYSMLAMRSGALRKMTRNTSNAENKLHLAEVLAISPRFRDMTLDYYVNIVDPDSEKQFSAVTVRLSDHSAFIAYRGTDNTITGWKENFNMAFMCPVPAQEESVNYINNVARWTHRVLRVGGHSKGGNLAMYAAVFCEPTVQARIQGVYTHDSPGFKNMIYDSPQYEAIASKVHSLLPQSSKIGTLLIQNTKFKVVLSNGEGFDQHDPFTWRFSGTKLQYTESLTEEAMRFDAVLDNWLERMDDKRRRTVVEAFFELIDSTDADSFDDVIEYVKSGELTSYKKLSIIEPDVRKELLNIFMSLGKAYIGTRKTVKAKNESE